MQSIAEDWGIPMTVVYLCTAIIPLIFPITMTATNRDRQRRGQTDFSLKATLGLSEKDEKHSKAYLDAAYPKAPQNYTMDIPSGLIVGKQGNVEKGFINGIGVNIFWCKIFEKNTVDFRSAVNVKLHPRRRNNHIHVGRDIPQTAAVFNSLLFASHTDSQTDGILGAFCIRYNQQSCHGV